MYKKILLLLVLTSCSHRSLKYDIPKPESCHFFNGNTYFGSIAGGMTEKSGKSSLMYMKNGRPENLIGGLNAPKGIRGFQNYLVVTDIDEIKLIHLHKKAVTITLSVPGAKFLNDIDVDNKGNFYASDSIGQTIYTGNILKKKVSKLLEVDFVPNGVLLDDGRLMIASWGQEMDAKWNTKENGRLWKYNLKSKKLSLYRPERIGHLDGIEKVESGGFYVSSKRENKIYHFVADAPPVVIKKVTDPADIGFNGDLICVPSLGHDKLEIFRP